MRISIGIVTKKIKGFYYVESNNEVFECRLRGLIKRSNNKDNCVIGDRVEFSEEKKVIDKIEKRKNILYRPLVANLDYIVITFAAKAPKIEFNRLNLMLLNAFFYNVKPILLINKIELISEEELDLLKSKLKYIEEMDIKIFYVSTYNKLNLNPLKDYLKDSISAFGGPSGVGKSSILNEIQTEINLEIGELSKKIDRGKHTTKGATLLHLEKGGYVIDTPGFSSLDLPDIKNIRELISVFPLIEKYGQYCKFNDCLHINEPKCEVKNKVEEGIIPLDRYNLYKTIYYELKIKWNKY